jgi:hypothetical protein
MNKTTRTLATLAAAGSLIAAPAVAQGAHKDSHGKGKSGASHGKGKAKHCAKAHKVGFSVRGTLVLFTADDPGTKDVNESSVTLKVTGANHNARVSGDIADQDATKDGTQVEGATYTVAGEDVKLNGYEGADTPSVGDKVKVNGKITRTKKNCAPAGTDRYGAVDVRKVTISDRDQDAPEQPEQPEAPAQP